MLGNVAYLILHFSTYSNYEQACMHTHKLTLKFEFTSTTMIYIVFVTMHK